MLEHRFEYSRSLPLETFTLAVPWHSPCDEVLRMEYPQQTQEHNRFLALNQLFSDLRSTIWDTPITNNYHTPRYCSMLYIEIASKPMIWSCLVFQDTLATLEQEMLEESRSMRLAIGHFVDKEPHLDLVTVPWWLLWYPLIASMRPVWYSYVCIGLPMPHMECLGGF